MMRLLPLFLGCLLLVGNSSAASAASQKATALRKTNSLTIFTPPEKFLAGNFVAEEMTPDFIFGPIKSFVASRKCPTTWLIEAGAKNAQGRAGSPGQPAEYTLYLEEDCPDKVIYYVFIDQSGLTPQQWIDYRRQFHGQSKTEPEYGPTKSKLEQACQEGYGVGAELRFIQKNGELLNQSPEKFLRQDLKFAPIYDLNQGKKISQ
ncbi:MAG: hypothetical protein WBV23_12500 [Desulfobaccales bacterium]